MWYQKQPRI